MVNNDLEKIAMQLLDFQLVDVTKVALPEPKTKKEKAKKCSEIIVATAHISDGRGRCRRQFFFKPGNALKMPNRMWQVVLNTGKQRLISEIELLDSKHWCVKKAFNDLNRLQKKKQDQKLI
jgi:hypothetical protein